MRHPDRHVHRRLVAVAVLVATLASTPQALPVAAQTPHDLGGPIAFTFNDPDTGTHGVYVTSSNNESMDRVYSGDEWYGEVEWTPDGSSLVFTAFTAGFSRTDLLLGPATGGATLSLAHTSDSGRIEGVRVSPDGRRIAFSRTDDSVGTTLHVVDIDGANEVEVSVDLAVPGTEGCGESVSGRTRVSAHDWAPDSRRLLVEVNASYCYEEYSKSKMMIVDVVSQEQRELAPYAFQEARWSADGQDIAFAPGFSLDIVRADSGEPVASLSGIRPSWSRGGLLAFIRPRDHEETDTYDIWVTSQSDPVGESRLLVQPGAFIHAMSWSSDGGHLAYAVGPPAGRYAGGAGDTLYEVDVDDGLPRQVRTPAGGSIGDYDYPRPQVQVERLGGPTRIETAVAVSRRTFPDGGFAEVFLARDDLFPDALAASFPAGDNGGQPILLTPTGSLHPATRAEIERLTPERVVIMGSEVAVGEQVEAEIRAMGIDTVRLSGNDRYETAAAAARYGDMRGEVIVATGLDFPDALASGPVAFHVGSPLLLTTPDKLHPAARAVIEERQPTGIVVVGGERAVSANTYDQLQQLCQDIDDCVQVRRLRGRNRTETAIQVADYFDGRVDGDWTHVNLARGDAFPDAAVGGPHGGHEAAPILLTQDPSVLGDETALWLDARVGITSIHVFGTDDAIGDAVLEQARAAASNAE